MTKTKKPSRAAKPLPYVVVRCTAAGVHAGELVTQSGPNVSLRNHGNSKIGCPIEVFLTDACEVILCSEVAAKSIKEAPSHVRTN